MQAWTQSQKSYSPYRSPEGLPKNSSFLGQLAGSGLYRSNSREKESKTDRGLPLLHPQLNIGDITYSFKEKITINTAPNKNAAPSFNLYTRGPPKEEAPQASFVKTSVPYDYRRANNRNESTDPLFSSQLQGQAAKSFDFSKPSKRPQMTATDFYSRDVRKSTSQENGEPKSRKLLEMMLKRMSKLNVEEEPSLTHARSFSRNTNPARNWENKSVSMDQNKKKLNLTMSRNYEPQNVRRSSRESQKGLPPGTGSSGTFQQKPSGSTTKSKPIQIRSLRVKHVGNS